MNINIKIGEVGSLLYIEVLIFFSYCWVVCYYKKWKKIFILNFMNIYGIFYFILIF